MNHRLFMPLAALLIAVWVSHSADKYWYDKKPFEQWEAKEIESMLEKSPWVQTHIYQTSSAGSAITSAAQLGGGISSAAGRDISVDARNYLRYRWLSARPVRMALAALAMRNDPTSDAEALRRFALESMQDVVIAVSLESSPAGSPVLRILELALRELSFEEAAAETRLRTKTKKDVPLKAYRPPTGDGLGAQFIYARSMDDGRPLLEPIDKEVRFTTRIRVPTPTGEESIHIRLTYKVKDMLYRGSLEY